MRDIVGEFGENIVGEPRLRAIVGDYMPGDRAMRLLLSRAVSDNVGRKLLEIRGLDDQEFDLRLASIRQTFQEDNLLRLGVADYIVDCFMYSLGWTDSVPADITECRNGGTPVGELSFAAMDDGTEYCGSTGSDGCRSGFGVEKRAGSCYAGEWKIGMRHGIGMETDDQRCKYAGEWSVNKRKGVGMQLFADGVRYAGQWKNGNPDGPGMLFLPGGKCLCGVFARGRMVPGYGMCYLNDGSYVTGMMTAYGPDGECERHFSDGTSQVEHWTNGIMDV